MIKGNFPPPRLILRGERAVRASHLAGPWTLHGEKQCHLRMWHKDVSRAISPREAKMEFVNLTHCSEMQQVFEESCEISCSDNN